MTRKFDAWAKANGATFYPVHPNYETVLGHKCYTSIFDVPGDIDLAIILTGQAVDTFEEVLAAQGEVRGDLRGRLLRDRQGGREARSAASSELVRARRRAPARPEHEPQRVRGLPRRPRRARRSRSSPSRATRAGPVFQGQEIGIRLTHWAPTGNEVDLEFADFARYFADQPEVGVIACYIEGFKDGRTLMLAADHAAKLQQADRDGEGRHDRRRARRWRSRHTGHLTGSDAVTERGVPPVRRHPRRRPRRAARGLGRVRAHAARRGVPAWAKKEREPGVCVYAISGGTGAHMADMLAAAGPVAPRPHEGDAEGAARRPDPRVPAGQQPGRLRRPAGRRRARPQDPRRDPRRPERRHRDRPDHRRGRDVLASRSRATSSRSRRPPTSRSSWCGARRPGTDDTYYKRLLDGGLPVFRTFGNCVDGGAGLRRLLDASRRATARRSTTRRPTPLARGEEGAQAARRGRARRGALGVASRSSCSRRTASRRRRTSCASSAAAAVQGRERDRLPGRDEGLVARPAAQERRSAS